MTCLEIGNRFGRHEQVAIRADVMHGEALFENIKASGFMIEALLVKVLPMRGIEVVRAFLRQGIFGIASIACSQAESLIVV